MNTVLSLVINDDKGTLATQEIRFREEPVEPLPSIGDTVIIEVGEIAAGDETHIGKVFSRRFDYSRVREGDTESATLSITIFADGA
jgi:hypothetical protein